MRSFFSRVPRGFVIALHDISAARAESLIEALQPIQPVPLSEIVERSKAGKKTAGLCAITVDDGEGQTIAELAPLFQKRGWPATFYLPTNYIELRETIAFQWWRAMARVLPRRRLRLISGELDLSHPQAVLELGKKMEHMWHSARREAYLPQLIELAGLVSRRHNPGSNSVDPVAPASWDSIRALAKDDLLSFESHGVSHTAMSALNEKEVRQEMEESRELIEERTGRPCRHFAYPFGSAQSIGPIAAKVARLFYDSAVTMQLGHVDSSDPYLLPRIPLYPENPAWKARMKVLLKCTAFSRTSVVISSGYATN